MEKRSKVTFDIAIKSLWNKIISLTYEEIDGKLVKRQLKWSNIISLTISHGVAIYALVFTAIHTKIATVIFMICCAHSGGLGVTAGVHRLWTHRSYKAKLPLRILLAICFSIAGQNTIPQWVLDHRVHHKFTETDADPHNAARGFFFSHVGWLMQNKSKAVLTKGKQVDMSDVLADPVVQFHTKYFILFKVIFSFVLPSVIPVYCWNETWYRSIMVSTILRYVVSLNSTWLVNSAAHLWGNKPYDARIGPVENKTVSYLALGEGWHNYHHVFPWDYKAAEYGVGPNLTTIVLNFFAYIGWAYELKCPSNELVNKVSEKYGDGSRGNYEVLPPKDGEEDLNVVFLTDTIEQDKKGY